ncbi:MAG: permease [Polyangiaceae bacterium]|nr:permease [Polyangiaceae bacterium]
MATAAAFGIPHIVGQFFAGGGHSHGAPAEGGHGHAQHGAIESTLPEPRDVGPISGEQRMALELGFVGLMVHRAADGVALAAYSGDHGHSSDIDVVLAIAAHSVPVVAVVVLAFSAALGKRSALLRAVALAAASVAGIALTGLVPPEWLDALMPWVNAVFAGLLLHVVGHDLTANAPRSASDRTLDLFAGALGFSVALLGDHAHHDVIGASQEAEHALRDVFAGLFMDTAPMLLLGLLVGATLQSFESAIPARWLRETKPLKDATRGALVGIPLPLCSCSVLPVSAALQKRAAAPAMVVAFLIATPELGVETLTLSGQFLGWPFAIMRLVGAFCVAIAAGIAVSMVSSNVKASGEASNIDVEVAPQRSRVWKVILSFDELLAHIGAWMVLGMLIAAFTAVFIPNDAFASFDNQWLELLAVTAVAVPSYVCAPAATPLAAILIAKGLSPGAVLVGLLLGPATNLATLGFLRSSFGFSGAFACIAAVIGTSWGLGIAANDWLATSQGTVSAVHAHAEHGVLSFVAASLLFVLLLRSLWLMGTRAWIASLGTTHTHGHA